MGDPAPRRRDVPRSRARSRPEPRLDFSALPARRRTLLVRPRRRGRPRVQRHVFWQRTAIVAALAALAALVLGLAFAGSPRRLADGVRIDGTGATPHPHASIVPHGLTPQIVSSRGGRVLDRHAAAATIVRALASLGREPVGLPVRDDPPQIKAGDLKVAEAEVRTALSAPVHLTLGGTRWNLRPGRLSRLLELPADGRRALRLSGTRPRNSFTP